MYVRIKRDMLHFMIDLCMDSMATVYLRYATRGPAASAGAGGGSHGGGCAPRGRGRNDAGSPLRGACWPVRPERSASVFEMQTGQFTRSG